ncbi:hypothetical protein P3S67_005235 [Capsicum chacoense]
MKQSKKNDRAVLLEGGGLQSTSPRIGSSSVTSQISRFFLMDGIFLLENRLTLRAISEFGALLTYFYLSDRTNLFGESKKVHMRTTFFLLLPSHHSLSNHFF